MTYTVVTLEVSPAAYEEIRKKLVDAEYWHTISGKSLSTARVGEHLDLTHIALVKRQADIIDEWRDAANERTLSG